MNEESTNERIKSSDISVVVQGAVEKKYVQENVKAIRTLLPDAEIIVSTWENTDVDGIVCDKIIINKDPGAEYYTKKEKLKLNINRMLVSSKEGIEQCTRKYILKMRSDLVLVNLNFLNEFFKYPARNSQYAITKERIVCISLFTLRYESEKGKRHYTPFHVSDWCCFGLAEDIRMLFDVDLVDAKDYSQYLAVHHIARQCPIESIRDRLWKYPPEQYITSNLAKRKFVFKFDNWLDYNAELCELSENVIINNFIVLDAGQFKLISYKKQYKRVVKDIAWLYPLDWSGGYRNYVYQRKYKELCDADYKIGLDIGMMRHYCIMIARVLFWPIKRFCKYIVRGMKR